MCGWVVRLQLLHACLIHPPLPPPMFPRFFLYRCLYPARLLGARSATRRLGHLLALDTPWRQLPFWV